MHFVELGRGEPVLLLHGSPSPASDFVPVATRLAVRHRVLIPDLPGTGRSARADDATIAVVDQDVADELAARDAGRLRAIVGFSSGGYRALEMVVHGRVTADLVICLGGFATLDEPARARRRELAARIDAAPSRFHGHELRGLLHDLMLSPAWRAAHPAGLRRVHEWVQSVDARGFADELRALAGSPDLRPALPRLPARAYFRVGELDLAAPPALSRELAALVPGGRVDVVPGCGHALLMEDLAGTCDAIARELAA